MMINKIIQIVAFLIVIQASAQDSIKIINAEVSKVRYEGKPRPSLEYVIDVDFKSLEKHWEKFLSDSYNAKVKEKKSTYLIAKDLVVSSISDMRIDLLVIAKKQQSKWVVNFAGAFGYDIYIDQEFYPKELEALKMVVDKFLFDSSNMYYHENLANLSKKIAKINKNSELLANENMKLNTKIIEENAELKVLEESDTSSKIKKKISKLAKKKVSYKSKITGNKEKILKNHNKFEKLNKEVAYFKERQQLLNQ